MRPASTAERAIGSERKRSPYLEAAARVDAGRRFVQKQDVGPPHQRSGEVEAPFHSAGVRAHQAVGVRGQRKPLQHLRGAVAGGTRTQVVPPPDHLHRLTAGQVFVHGGELAGQSDAVAHRNRVVHHVDSGDRRGAAIRPEQRGQDTDQRGLAGPVRPQQGVDDAGLDLQADAGKGMNVAEPLFDLLGTSARRHVRWVAYESPRQKIPIRALRRALNFC